MCFNRQPAPPINTPSYAPEDQHRFVDSQFTDTRGRTTDLDGRTTAQNLKDTGVGSLVPRIRRPNPQTARSR